MIQSILSGELFNFGETIIKRLWPDPVDQQKALSELRKLEQNGDLAQMGVNMAEAKHESLFVAGWRPCVGWVCALAFGYSFIAQPFFIFIATFFGRDLSTLPQLDLSTMMPVLMGMLGLGWLRTQEKREGVNKRR